MTVTWSSPSSDFTGFRVTLDGANDQTLGEDAFMATFNGLTSGTEYTIAVFTVNNDEESTKVETSATTSKY